MDTPCRHCKQPIAEGARRCHHCQAHQGWLADQRDPRTIALVLGMMAIVIVPLLALMWRTSTAMNPSAARGKARLEVTDPAARFDHAADGTQAFVFMKIRNVGDHRSSSARLRVEFRGADGHFCDGFRAYIAVTGLEPGGTSDFRVSDRVLPEAETCQVSVALVSEDTLPWE